MAYDIGPRIGIDGEEEFRKSLLNINQNIKTLGSEMGSVVSAFADGEKSQDAMSAQTDVLTRQIAAQREKLKMLTDMMEKSADKFGENDTKTLKWKQAVYEATTQLNKMEKQLDETGDELDDIEKGLDQGAKSALSFGDVLKANLLGDAIKSGISAVGNAISGLISGLAGLDESTEEYRVAQGKLYAAYEAAGKSTESLQKKTSKLTVAFGDSETAVENTGLSAKDAETAYNGLYAILGDTGTAVEAAQLLANLAENSEDVSEWTNIAAGVAGAFGDALPITSLIEAANETAKVGTVTGALADALNWVGISEDEFNEKLAACSSEQERNQLITDTLTNTYADAADAFYENNEAIIETRKNQALLDQSTASLGDAASKIKNQVKSDFLPAFSKVASAFSGIISGAEGAKEDFSIALNGLIEQGVAKIPEFLSLGSNILGGLVNGIVENLPALLNAGGKILMDLISGVREGFPSVVSTAGNVLGTLIDGLVSGLPMVLETGAEMLVTLVTGIADSLPELVPTIVGVALALVETLTKPDVLVSLLDAGLKLIVGLAEGLVKAIPELIQAIPIIIKNLVSSIVEFAPKLLAAGVQLLVTLGAGLIQAIPELAANVPKVIAAIIGGIKEGISKIKEIGKNIVSGLWEGIQSMGSWLKDKFFGLFNGLTEGINKLLGIHSPSRVFAGIGGYMAEGLGQGFGSEIKGVQNQINRSMEDLIPDASGSVSLTAKSDSAVGFADGSGGYIDMVAAFREAMSGMTVTMDGRKVGTIVTRQQNTSTRASGVPVTA